MLQAVQLLKASLLLCLSVWYFIKDLSCGTIDIRVSPTGLRTQGQNSKTTQYTVKTGDRVLYITVHIFTDLCLRSWIMLVMPLNAGLEI